MIRLKSHAPLMVILVLFVVLVSSAVTVKPVHAAGIYVNTTVDENTNNSSCSLREAIIAANTNSFYNGCTGGSAVDGDVIMLPSATYTLSSALPVITSNMEIRRDGVTTPIVQAHAVDWNLATFRVFEIGGGGNLYINGLTVRRGRCSNSCSTSLNSGGGIYNAGTLYINESTVINNLAGDDGAGIYNTGSLFISNSTISGNQTLPPVSGHSGGGIYNAGELTMTNCTVSGNYANGSGGGIFNAMGHTLTMFNCTISNNSVPINPSNPTIPMGGGIVNATTASLSFTNTIIANSSNGDCINSGTIGTNVKNLVENGSCSPYLSGDPKLSSLRDNGGYTYTHALLIGSIAIDAGDATACPGHDQRRVTRPQGVGCDIGAYEQDDFTAPTSLSIVVADPALRIGETSLVTFTFDEAVTGFANADLVIENATLSTVSSADGGVTWTATLTPDGDVEDESNQVSLDMAGLTDLVGNPGSGTAYSNTYAVDTIRPTATIEVQTTSLAIGDTSKVSITFSEPVESFTVDDLEADNGSFSDFTAYPGDTSWSVTLSPDPGIEDDTNVITLDNTNIRDMAGNPGLSTTDSNNYAIDTIRPTVVIDVEDSSLIIGDTTTVTFSFSEEVVGFTNADLTIPNATLSDVTGTLTWIATLTPNNGVEDNSNVITIDLSGVTDLAGNTGTGTVDSNNYLVDTLRPTAAIVVADDVLIVGETSLVTITFSEAVSGFTNADLSIANGILTDVGSSDGGITWTATLTPSAGVTDPTNVITLTNAGVADIAGNAGSGTSSSNNYYIDTEAPTLKIEQADGQEDPTHTSPINFKVSFSEFIDPALFIPADVTLAGTANPTTVVISQVTPPDGTIFNLAVSGMSGSGTVSLSIDAGVVEDMAGNLNEAGVSDDNTVTYDIILPTSTIVVTDTVLIIGDTSLVTITFSEAILGFTNADLTVANGTLTDVSSSDGGITWTATLTPTNGVTDPTNVIVLDNSAIQDLAGNLGVGTTTSNNYVIDTVAPSVTVEQDEDQADPTDSSPILFTVTFSEAVDPVSFTPTDVTLEGTAGATSVVVSDIAPNIGTKFTLIVSGMVGDGTVIVSISADVVEDMAGNGNTASTSKDNVVTYNTTPPDYKIFLPLIIR